MKTHRPCLLLAWTVFFSVLLALAPAAQARTWTDITGKFKVEGELVELKDGTVRLRLTSGKLISLPLEKLSAPDQAFAQKAGSSTKPPKASDAPADSQATPKSKPAAKGKTGKYSTSFDEHSPLANTSVVFPRALAPNRLASIQKKLNQEGKSYAGYYYKPEEETWDVYVPEDYGGDVPYGLFVFINSGGDAGLNGSWQPVLKKHRLIFVGANKSGNGEDTLLRRIPLAIDAVHNMKKRYLIDEDRIYISGNSGGGRAASWTAIAFADVFTGGQFHIGSNSYSPVPLGGGKFITGDIHIPSQKLMQHAAQNNRYAFITGDKDFNRDQMQKISSSWQKDGFRYITYLQVPGMGHSAPPADWFEKGIVSLDKPLRAAAQATFDEAGRLVSRGKLGDALIAFGRAATHGHDQSFAAEAQRDYAKVRAQYDAAVGKVEKAIAAGDPTLVKQISEFRKTWGKAGASDAQRLVELAREARKKK